jgi:hypothetical protein
MNRFLLVIPVLTMTDCVGSFCFWFLVACFVTGACQGLATGRNG